MTLNWAFMMERVTGIEPASRAWEALILPLNYTRSDAECITHAAPTQSASDVTVGDLRRKGCGCAGTTPWQLSD
jgi:hypothetical protein